MALANHNLSSDSFKKPFGEIHEAMFHGAKGHENIFSESSASKKDTRTK
jgi:hypothetical protein